MDARVFAQAFETMGHAFDRPPGKEMTVQYYQYLGQLSEDQLGELFQWATDNLDVPFPRIAALLKRANEQGWLREERNMPERDPFVSVCCLKCGEEILVRRYDLAPAAAKGWVVRCQDHGRTGCKEMMPAGEALKQVQEYSGIK